MDLQHATGSIPGIEYALANPPEGSIAAALTQFLLTWVEPLPLTSRRTYERTLMMLVKDLQMTGPDVSESTQKLSAQRLESHLDWRISVGLDDTAELLRTGVHLARLASWLDANVGSEFGDLRDQFRAYAASLTDTSV